MSCSPIIVRDYFLDELAADERRQVEAHVKGCVSCREEFDRLRVTQAALRSVVDEEIPQRIAFVSDKIFEPSPWKRGLAAFWNSGARLGFAAAAMLSCALVYSAATRPAAAPAQVTASVASAAAPTTPVSAGLAPASALTEQEIQRRIDLAVDRAVSVSERHHDLLEAKLVRQVANEHASVILASDQVDYLSKLLQREKKLKFGTNNVASLQEPQQ
jgi:anti-sigma factor RsiW